AEGISSTQLAARGGQGAAAGGGSDPVSRGPSSAAECIAGGVLGKSWSKAGPRCVARCGGNPGSPTGPGTSGGVDNCRRWRGSGNAERALKKAATAEPPPAAFAIG